MSIMLKIVETQVKSDDYEVTTTNESASSASKNHQEDTPIDDESVEKSKKKKKNDNNGSPKKNMTDTVTKVNQESLSTKEKTMPSSLAVTDDTEIDKPNKESTSPKKSKKKISKKTPATPEAEERTNGTDQKKRKSNNDDDESSQDQKKSSQFNKKSVTNVPLKKQKKQKSGTKEANKLQKVEKNDDNKKETTALDVTKKRKLEFGLEIPSASESDQNSAEESSTTRYLKKPKLSENQVVTYDVSDASIDTDKKSKINTVNGASDSKRSQDNGKNEEFDLKTAIPATIRELFTSKKNKELTLHQIEELTIQNLMADSRNKLTKKQIKKQFAKTVILVKNDDNPNIFL
ncbi:6330_t:CDS:2, partial [Ambispora leptoticha]